MKCADCGASLQGDHGECLLLECAACARFAWDCDCKRAHGYLPLRWVHCTRCDEYHITRVDTSQAGWRGVEVEP